MCQATQKFQLPKDAEIYTASIFERSRHLIAYNLWSGIQHHRLDAWIQNFHNDEERYFAAKVLDALIYRSKDQTTALMRHLFQRTLPDLQRSTGICSPLSSAYLTLKSKDEPNIRIAPVLPPTEPPIKSGASIGRHLRRSLRFESDWIIKPNEIPNYLTDGKTIIIFDDFLGTGDQFIQFISESKLEQSINSGNCIYTPLVAHEFGLDRLKGIYPNLFLATVEKLDETHALFHESNGSFPDEVNSIESAREFYFCLLDNRRMDTNAYNRRGFGYFELLYAFEDAVPDNSLPILWWADSPDWRPLFDR